MMGSTRKWWPINFIATTIFHDCIVHPICGVIWSLRPFSERVGKAGDWLHNWSNFGFK